MTRYAISLDTDSVTEILDELRRARPDAKLDAPAALETLAIHADTTFYNVVVIPSTDTHFFCASVRFAFDASPADVAAYCAYYDADPEIVEPV